ncbi:BrnT family toxin [Nostoc sp. CENA543]|uniref:BrnT family toxin n=1 Tax=Nostoc sp. CENA543 TaxID=1869241 RepID=UPI001CEF6E22|nr:BrnT family toxin [Nostoc sp. CENA543]
MIFPPAPLLPAPLLFHCGEDRWFGIGFLGNGVAVVVWTERKNNVIRIISARRANRYERQRLEQYLSY